MKSLIILVATCSVVFTCQSNSDLRDPIDAHELVLDSLTHDLAQLLQASEIPGFAVTIVQDGNTLYQQGFGYADLKNQRRFTSLTVQPIASVSKTFLGLAIMQLIEKGLLSLDEPINTILPYSISNPYHPDVDITVRHLVTHTSTITDNYDDLDESVYWLLEDPAYQKEEISEEIYDRIDYFTRGTPIGLDEYITNVCLPDGKWYDEENFLDAMPGSRFEYSNLGASIAARIVEVKSGMSYDAYTRRHIFEPLGMDDTGWQYTDIRPELIATLYAKGEDDEDPIPFPPYHDAGYPEGQLKTNVADMTRYLLEMIGGVSEKGEWLSSQSYATLFEAKLNDSHFEDRSEYIFNDEYNIGVFWGISHPGYILHNGAMDGVLSFLIIDPEARLGAFAFCNLYDGDFGEIRQTIYNYMKLLSAAGQ